MVGNLRSFFIWFFITLNHFINNFGPGFKLIIGKIIFLFNVKVKILIFLLNFLYKLISYKHEFIIVDIKSFANQVISLVSWNYWCKEYFSIQCCYWDGIVKYNGIVLFFYLFYVWTGNFQLCFTKENVWWIESWMKKQTMGCDIKTARYDNVIAKATLEVTYISLFLFENNVLLNELFIVFAERQLERLWLFWLTVWTNRTV